MINDDLVAQIEVYEDKKNKGYIVNGGEVTALYNRVLDKNVPSTNCGSCIRRRIEEMVDAKNKYLAEKKARLEAEKQQIKASKKAKNKEGE